MALSNPTLLQLALAVQLNRFKPPNVSVRDYILRLREHIYPGPRPQFSATYEESQKNYINAAFYFEALFKNAQRKNDELRNRIVKLERQQGVVDELLLQDSIAEEPSSRREAHVSLASKNASGMAAEGLGSTYDRLRNTGICEQTLLRHVYNLQMALQEVTGKARRTCRLLGRVCTAFGLTLEDMLQKLEAHGEDHEKSTLDPECSVRALSRILSLVFSSFTILIRSNSEREVDVSGNDETQNSVPLATYSILSLFRTIIKCIPSTPNNNKNNHDNLGPETPSTITLDSPKRLARAFIAHLLNYKAQTDQHPHLQTTKAFTDLLEGVLAILLTRAGNLLYTSTFSRPRSETIAAEISATEHDKEPSALTDNTSNTTNNVASHTTGINSDPHATDTECRTILSLLRLALPSYEGHAHRVGGNASATASTLSTEVEEMLIDAPGHPRSLVAKPLDTIQNTLVRGIFGSPASLSESLSPRLDDRSYSDGTYLPRSAADGRDVALLVEDEDEAEDGDEGDWFAREMWGLVGWEVLARGFDASNDGERNGEKSGLDD